MFFFYYYKLKYAILNSFDSTHIKFKGQKKNAIRKVYWTIINADHSLQQKINRMRKIIFEFMRSISSMLTAQ